MDTSGPCSDLRLWLAGVLDLAIDLARGGALESLRAEDANAAAFEIFYLGLAKRRSAPKLFHMLGH